MSPCTLLQLLLAALCVLTATPQGLVAATAVLLLLVARQTARHHLAASTTISTAATAVPATLPPGVGAAPAA